MLRALTTLDRRWIYLAIFLSAALPMLFPFRLPSEPARDVVALHRYVDGLPNGCTVICAFDYEPGSAVELDPAAMACIYHLWTKEIRIISFTLWPAGGSVAESVYKRMAAKMQRLGMRKEYGKDWVNMGYKAGNAVVLRNMGSGFANVFPRDMYGTPTSQLPLMRRVNRYADLAMLLDFSVGDPGLKQYIQVGQGQYGLPVGGATIAVNAPEMAPFLASHQLVGLMGGLRGAADYEKLVDQPGTATQGMNVQSIVHLVICGFIILSNVTWLATRRRSRGRRD